MSTLSISEFQNGLLQIPLEVSIFAGGGKGGGKSFGLCLLTFQHCEWYEKDARCLILRKNFADTEQLVSHFYLIFGAIYGKAARNFYNKSDHLWSLPNGATIEIGFLEAERDVLRYSGRGKSFLGVDEVQQIINPRLLALVRANLRGPALAANGKPLHKRIVYTANPGGTLHAFLEQTYIRPLTQDGSWPVFREPDTDRLWCYSPSIASANPYLDVTAHLQEMNSLKRVDAELAKAYQTGDWSIAAGDFFASAWRPHYSIIDPWPELPDFGWWYFLSLDHGGASSATACLLCAKALEGTRGPNGDYFPKGSVVIVDEAHDADDDYSGTLAYPIAKMCGVICDMCDHYNMRADGYGDPQICQSHGAATDLVDEYASNGVNLQPWKQHRREERWALLKELMAHALPAEKRDRPGLYVTRRCQGWLDTVPVLPTDPRRRNDLDTRAFDHFADASAGSIFAHRHIWTTGEILL